MDEVVELIKKVRIDGVSPVVGELGVATGSRSRELATYLKETGGTLICIDWFEGSMVEDRYVVARGLKDEFLKNMQPFNFVLVPLESGVAASLFKDGLFDLFWIDADHRYHSVKRDIELWLPKVKKGGILCGHDYDRETFKEEFIERDYEEGSHHGVTKAVNEKFGIPNVSMGTWWVPVLF